ncbi:hypothetical protein [Ectobacillus antri]|uniref:hypothetical protein n=1 Tax=Ectobacillus antri TaxID=2486280 RepID=UPI000F5A111F|nr:hypothetical protein [Ectobacillus antri]
MKVEVKPAGVSMIEFHQSVYRSLIERYTESNDPHLKATANTYKHFVAQLEQIRQLVTGEGIEDSPF